MKDFSSPDDFHIIKGLIIYLLKDLINGNTISIDGITSHYSNIFSNSEMDNSSIMADRIYHHSDAINFLGKEAEDQILIMGNWSSIVGKSFHDLIEEL